MAHTEIGKRTTARSLRKPLPCREARSLLMLDARLKTVKSGLILAPFLQILIHERRFRGLLLAGSCKAELGAHAAEPAL